VGLGTKLGLRVCEAKSNFPIHFTHFPTFKCGEMSEVNWKIMILAFYLVLCPYHLNGNEKALDISNAGDFDLCLF